MHLLVNFLMQMFVVCAVAFMNLVLKHAGEAGTIWQAKIWWAMSVWNTKLISCSTTEHKLKYEI